MSSDSQCTLAVSVFSRRSSCSSESLKPVVDLTSPLLDVPATYQALRDRGDERTKVGSFASARPRLLPKLGRALPRDLVRRRQGVKMLKGDRPSWTPLYPPGWSGPVGFATHGVAGFLPGGPFPFFEYRAERRPPSSAAGLVVLGITAGHFYPHIRDPRGHCMFLHVCESLRRFWRYSRLVRMTNGSALARRRALYDANLFIRFCARQKKSPALEAGRCV
jgi:hypothetical protein